MAELEARQSEVKVASGTQSHHIIHYNTTLQYYILYTVYTELNR